MPSGEGPSELTSEFRNAKMDLDQELHHDLQRDLDSINRDFSPGHSQRAVRIEDACCGHLSRTAKRFWEELLTPAPLSHQRRSELFQRAINEAFQEIGACARKCGGYEAVENFRDWLIQQDAIRRQRAEAEDASRLFESKPDFPHVQEADEATPAQAATVAKPDAKPEFEARTWKEVEISFFNEFSIQITVGQNKTNREFGFLGMAHERSGKPTLAWHTLHDLALANGVLSRPTGRSNKWPILEKRMQELRAWFRGRFGISSDPLPFVKGTGYMAEFKICCAPSYQR